MPFSNATELEHMIHKSLSYQGTPVTGELKHPLLVGEFLYEDPLTWGQDYLELIVDDHNDNGYFTHGIPSAENEITRLYDTLVSLPNNIFYWDVPTLLDKINSGASFIHHCGHSNETYMMRLNNFDITNQNFSEVDGLTHNYQLMYSHGCLCGAFDYPYDDCIAEKCVTISNFLVGGVFNSRYGWFDQGLTEGPSGHLHREFISALYNDTVANSVSQLGTAHMVSKIKTAPWIGLPGEFEPGAQRWCQYDCNVFGDPAMTVWIDEPTTGIGQVNEPLRIAVSPNPVLSQAVASFSVDRLCGVTLSLYNNMGQKVKDIYSGKLGQGVHQVGFSAGTLTPGIYFLRLEAGSATASTKVIVAE